MNAHKLLVMSARITNSLGGVLGSYNPLLIIVIICNVNLPQIKQTNNYLVQNDSEPTYSMAAVSSYRLGGLKSILNQPIP